MSNKKVEIPVQVTGAKEAREELKRTGKAVEQVGDSGSKQSVGTNQATAATSANAAAHQKAAPAIKQTAQATDQFDDSAKTAITGILGQFNPMLAGIANITVDVAKGIKNVTGTLIGMVGAGVAVAGIITFFQSIRSEIQKTREEAEKCQEQIDKIRNKFKSAQERMAATLQRYNALTPETEKAAGEMRRTIERAGFDADTAEKTAPLAVMGGLDLGEAKLAAQLSVLGVQFGKPGDIKAALQKLRQQKPELIADAEQQISVLTKTQTAIFRTMQAKPQPVGSVQHSAESLAREGMIASGALSESMSLTEFRRLLNEAKRLESTLRYMDERGVVGVERHHAYPDEAWGGKSVITEQAIRKRMQEIQGDQMLRAYTIAKNSEYSVGDEIPSRIPQAADRGAQAAEAVQKITNNTINMGTVHIYDRNGVLGTGSQPDPAFTAGFN